jgi:hypothetical protein
MIVSTRSVDASLAHRPAKTVEAARVLGGLKRRPGIRQFGLSRPLFAGEIALQVSDEITHHDTLLWPVVRVAGDKPRLRVGSRIRRRGWGSQYQPGSSAHRSRPVRNAVWRPPFVMYYRTCGLPAVRTDLAASGFTVTTVPLTALGRRQDGTPRYRLVLARA